MPKVHQDLMKWANTFICCIVNGIVNGHITLLESFIYTIYTYYYSFVFLKKVKKEWKEMYQKEVSVMGISYIFFISQILCNCFTLFY